MDSQTDIFPGSEVDIEEVHHVHKLHLIKYIENRCNQPCATHVAVMRDQTQMGKPLVAAGGSRGTGNEAD